MKKIFFDLQNMTRKYLVCQASSVPEVILSTMELKSGEAICLLGPCPCSSSHATLCDTAVLVSLHLVFRLPLGGRYAFGADTF